jgi:hypothetical protein
MQGSQLYFDAPGSVSNELQKPVEKSAGCVGSNVAVCDQTALPINLAIPHRIGLPPSSAFTEDFDFYGEEAVQSLLGFMNQRRFRPMS